MTNIFIFLIHYRFHSQDVIERYLNISKYGDEGKDWCANNLFSTKFCLQVLSMLMQHIDEGC